MGFFILNLASTVHTIINNYWLANDTVLHGKTIVFAANGIVLDSNDTWLVSSYVTRLRRRVIYAGTQILLVYCSPFTWV